MATYQELRTRSQQVRDEQNIGGNTALRVGQLLMDIVKYFYDNDAAASEYLQQHFVMVNDGTQLLNWQQSPIVILHTMGADYDDGDPSALSRGENYFNGMGDYIMEANGQGGGINGETPKANVLYVNLANDTLYTWNGASFDAITSGGGGGSISGDDIIKNAYYSNGNLVLVFETENGDKTVTIPVNFDASNYVPTSRTVNGKALSNNITLSQSDIPGLVAALAAKVGYSDNEWLQVKAGAMQAATAVPNTTTVNGKRLNNNIVIGMADIPGLLQAIANAGSGAVSVTTNQDGTFVIHVGETDYTINLNHTHEGMAKLEKVTEATLPQTMSDDTIYVQVDNVTNPQAIEALHIFGLEFTGGVPAGTPVITKPSGTTINLGENSGSGVSKSIEIKANSHITGDLTVALAANSDLSFDTTNLPSGVTYNSGAGTLTIAQATAMQGVNITVVYSGSGTAEIDGGLIITGGGASAKSMKVVVTEPAPIELDGVKFTGTQWLGTDYYPNPKTEFALELTFEVNSNTGSTDSSIGRVFMSCIANSSPTSYFTFYHIKLNSANDNRVYTIQALNEGDVDNQNLFKGNGDPSSSAIQKMMTPHSVLRYTVGSSNNHLAFEPGGVPDSNNNDFTSVNMQKKTSTMTNPLALGLQAKSSGSVVYSRFNLTIHRLTITEDGVAVRDYVPRIKGGVTGLLDIAQNGTGLFLTSETADELVAVPLSSNS